MSKLQLHQDNNTATIDGEIVIDARNVNRDKPKIKTMWIDPKAYKQMGELWMAARTAFNGGKDISQAILLKAKEILGDKAKDLESAEILGPIPEHWKEVTRTRFR